MHLLGCPNCSKKFRNIGNLAKHRHKKHSRNVAGEIRAGMRNSNKTVQAKERAVRKAIVEISEAALALTPAIVTRNPTLALAAIGDITQAVKAVKEVVQIEG